jgi:hypothetical protein
MSISTYLRKAPLAQRRKIFLLPQEPHLSAYRKGVVTNALQGGTWVFKNVVFKEGDEIIQEGDKSKNGFCAKEAVKAKSIGSEVLF